MYKILLCVLCIITRKIRPVVLYAKILITFCLAFTKKTLLKNTSISQMQLQKYFCSTANYLYEYYKW